MPKILLFATFTLSLAVHYFTGVGFGFGWVERTVAAIAAFLMFFFSAKRGLYPFFTVLLAVFSVSVSLGCAFLQPQATSGPLAVSITLHPWMIVVGGTFVAGLAWLWQERGRAGNRFASIMLALFALNWIVLAFNVKFYEDWKMENWLTVPFILGIYITHRWFRFSNVSYGLVFVFMMLHIYGSHYTYAEVPFGFWLQGVLDAARNHYDRIVHFGFGFLLAYPIREVILRISNTKGVWGYWFPVEFVLAFSAIYELLEWGIAVVFGGDLGVAYLGTQGDVWDAQKDMFNAGIGSCITMVVVACIVWYYRRGEFWRELRQSLSVKRTRALGEVALRDLRRS